jgi:hypothetical protein
MKRIVLGVAACVLGLSLAGQANAATRITRTVRTHAVHGRVIGHRDFGVHRTTYRTVRSYWGAPVWYSGRRCYWDRYHSCYYYFDAGCGYYCPCP